MRGEEPVNQYNIIEKFLVRVQTFLTISARRLCLSSALQCVLVAPIVFTSSQASEPKESKDPVAFARQNVIVDSHIDTPTANYFSPRDVLAGDSSVLFDYPRAIEGGLNAAFMSIYIPPAREDDGTAYELANTLIDQVEGWARGSDERFRIATCAADIKAQFDPSVVSLPMGMENGGPIEGKFTNVDHFFKRGIRYITLAHAKSNHISDSSYDENEAWGGLSPFGKELVPYLNDVGVMIDISHLTDNAAWQVLKLSKVPVVATHSSLRAFIPGFHRNMSDEMVTALGKQDGIIMINFGSSFVSQEARSWTESYSAAVEEYSADGSKTTDEIRAFREDYRVQHPYPFANVESVVDHIERVIDLAGIDHVGLGSDFDGLGPTLPVGLKDVSDFPNLVAELWKRGYSDDQVRKILGENFLNVWQAVEMYATKQGNPPVCQTAL